MFSRWPQLPLHAADMGLSASEICATIMEARDLAKKGSAKRQREYGDRGPARRYDRPSKEKKCHWQLSMVYFS